MKFSTEVIQKITNNMVAEVERLGVSGGSIQKIENGQREILRAVGAEALRFAVRLLRSAR